jgi:hypothetical protein
MASSKINIIMIINIWVNKKGGTTKLDEKTYLITNSSNDIEEVCITSIRKSMVAKIESDKTLQPYYSNAALEYMANYLNTEIKKCKDGPAKGIDVVVTANNVRKYEGEYVMYGTDLIMPKIKATITINSSSLHQEVWVKYKCAFTHSYTHKNTVIKRNYSYSFPYTKEYYYVVKKPSNNITLDLSNHVMPGVASFEIYDKGANKLIMKFEFKIGGQNPTSANVKKEITDKGYNSKYWFFENIVMGESGAKQFNDKGSKIGLPTFGFPDGWGLMQIDNWTTPTLKDNGFMFDWKKNIKKGYDIIEEKIPVVINHYKSMNTKIKNGKLKKYTSSEQGEVTKGNVKYSHVKTELTKLMTDCNTNFSTNPSGNKSFIDATLIKRYNGGSSPIKAKDAVSDADNNIKIKTLSSQPELKMNKDDYDIIRANGGEYYFIYSNEVLKKLEWRINEYNNLGFNYVQHVSEY